MQVERLFPKAKPGQARRLTKIKVSLSFSLFFSSLSKQQDAHGSPVFSTRAQQGCIRFSTGAERKVSALNTLHGRETKGEEWKSSWHTRVSKSKAKKRRKEKRRVSVAASSSRDTLFTARHPRQSRPISAPISPENVFPRAADDMKIATRPFRV